MEKRLNKYAPLIGILMLFALFVLTAAAIVLAITDTSYDLDVGSIAPETIYATHTVTDTVATNALKDAARANTPVVYRIDNTRANELIAQAETFFVSLGSLRSYAQGSGQEALSAAEWAQTLEENQKATMMNMTTPPLTEMQLCAVLAANDADLRLLENIMLPKLSTTLNAGLAPESIESVREACSREVEATNGINDVLKTIGRSVLQAYMQATFVEDADATELARNEAANAVESIRVKKGEPVVMEDDVITLSQLSILEDLGLVRPKDASRAPAIGAVLSCLVAFVMFVIYVVQRVNALLSDHKKLLLFCLLFLISILTYLFTSKLNVQISVAMYTLLLCATLISFRVALITSILLGFSLALMAGGTGNLLQFGSFSVFASTLFAGSLAAFAQQNTPNRAAYISAGALGGAAGAIAILGMSLTQDMAWSGILANMGFFLGSCVLSALLVVGSLTIWEKLFDIATPARLHELLNTNNPLLRQMMAEAPGTYQHCMSVAALCEAAAQRIGADPLLARVGASYHDVGKLRRPLYFAENQKKGENIHDTLPPQESASIIIAHQRDGVMLLNKYKFPGVVTRMVGEHHGNSLVAYFYYKALQNDPNVQMRDFRYPGSKPSTVESAILMLADSCEAGVRSLGECTQQAREEMVHKIIRGKMNEAENNLLDEVPITLKQIAEIEKSFLKTFNGIMHDRIEYPDDTEVTRA
ncbi:MAG: HDIG domain-containing protein [Eubacteriales bacterium]|nr:HDIG domain-containing protein [Eubacteriales bacterium]